MRLISPESTIKLHASKREHLDIAIQDLQIEVLAVSEVVSHHRLVQKRGLLEKQRHIRRLWPYNVLLLQELDPLHIHNDDHEL